jgi:alanine racemase
MVEKSTHSTCIIIHADHLLHNLKFLAGKAKKGIKKMSVVKADAYGHGAVSISRIAEPFTDWFGVASTEEAVELRDAGIVKPVLVFGVPVPETAPLYTKFGLTAVVSSMHQFEYLQVGTRYHISFDTGMGRLGFMPEQAGDVLEATRKYEHLQPEGIMSHFATADDPGSAKAYEQIREFKSVRAIFPDHLLTHMANSGGLIHYPESHFDMVRHGISMYGYKPGKQQTEGLKPVLGWEATIAQCRKLKRGETVSYGATWAAPADGYLYTVSAGYADGIPRLLSGKFSVVMNGKPIEQRGTVTMDYIMLFSDQPAWPNVDVVQILDTDVHHAGTWAETLDTIPYEIVCGINPKVKRIVKY